MARVRIEIHQAGWLPGRAPALRVELTGASVVLTFARAIAVCLPALRVDSPGLMRLLRGIRLQQVRREGVLPAGDGAPARRG